MPNICVNADASQAQRRLRQRSASLPSAGNGSPEFVGLLLGCVCSMSAFLAWALSAKSTACAAFLFRFRCLHVSSVVTRAAEPVAQPDAEKRPSFSLLPVAAPG